MQQLLGLLRLPACRLVYLQTKPKEEIRPFISHIEKRNIAFIKMARIFHIEIGILLCTYTNVHEKNLKKSTRKICLFHIL